ncbi:MAG: uroporphyrinogen-III synthase [Pseudomonadota bacterium]
MRRFWASIAGRGCAARRRRARSASSAVRLLLTRPEPGAARTARRLRDAGHSVICDPMLRIQPKEEPRPSGPFDAIAFTSANGVACFRGEILNVPVFAVGARTAQAARAAGFTGVTACDGDAAALAARLSADLPRSARILHPAGEERAADLAAMVAPAGLEIVTWEVYRARPAEALSDQTRSALVQGGLDGALHLSPRTVGALLACVAKAGLMEPFGRLRHFCLSPAVAAVLARADVASRVAPIPEEEALLALIEERRF